MFVRHSPVYIPVCVAIAVYYMTILDMAFERFSFGFLCNDAGISIQVETTPRPTARHISLMDGAMP